MAKASKASGAKDTQPKDVPATYRADPQQWADIQAIAYWERKTVKEVMSEASALRIAKYKKEHGELKSLPKK